MKKTLLILGTLLLTASSTFAYSMPRWGMTAVDVYIEENALSSTIERAFRDWSAASNGKLRFRFYSNRHASNNAPIKVIFTDDRAPYFLVKSKRYETTGYFTNMEDGFINRATIQVYTIDRDKKRATTEEIYMNALNEVGYILGLDKIYGKCEEESVMCMESLGKVQSLTDADRAMIIDKYERSSNDIKEQKSKPNNKR